MSSAIKHELFYIRDSVKEFNPKGIATMEQAAATLYRMLEPSLIRNADFHPHEFNKAFWSEQTSRNAHSVWRNDSNKVIVDTASSMGTGGIELPKEAGDYQVVLKSMQNGQIIEGTDYAFVYDKNDILKSDEYTTTFIGDGASGMFLNNNGKIRMITESGNVWNNKDSCAYAYKSYGNGDFEIVTTIEGLANTDADAAAGVMVRASNDPSDVKIDYRIKPAGDTFLCWRDAKGNITSFSQNAKLSFPATIKLVRRGDVFTAYYKDGTEWVANGTSPAIPAIGGNVVAGLMLYTRSDRSGKPSATTFKDTEIGAATGNVTDEKEEIKPAEKPQEVPEETPEVKFTINRGEHLDIFTNGGFERGVAGWSVVNGNVVKADAAYKGKGSLAFQPTSSSGMATYSLPEMNKKKTYYLIFRAKTKEGTASLSPYIQYHNGSGYVRSNMNFITDMTVTSDEWKEYVIEITFNDAVSSPLLVMSINSTKDVYFDCMELLHK